MSMILITGNLNEVVQQVICDLNKHFSIKTLGSLGYFLAFEVYRTNSALFLTQQKYVIDLLKKTNMFEAKSNPTPMCANSKLYLHDGEEFDNPTIYRRKIGALQYITLLRPDLAFVVNKLNQFLEKPTVVCWHACKRLLKYLKGTLTHGLYFKAVASFVLKGYRDVN